MRDTNDSVSDLLTVAFDRHGVTEMRHAVADRASGAGLAGQRLDGFVLAVNEIMTNAVRHGGGYGRLRLWCNGGALWCEVVDEGGATPLGDFNGYELPPTSATGGRGLWLARHLCDEVTVDAGRNGTTVRLTLALASE